MDVFLISLVQSEIEIQPLFITNNAIFGLEEFNNWKKRNGYVNELCKIEKLPYIEKEIEDDN